MKVALLRVRRQIAIALCASVCMIAAFAHAAQSHAAHRAVASVPSVHVAAGKTLEGWDGLTVAELRFEGVTARQLDPLTKQLALRPGAIFHAADLRASIRQLFATGLYTQIEAKGIRQGNTAIIIFQGKPQLFLHRVHIDGVKQDLLSAQLQRATRLEIGTKFTQQSLQHATGYVRESLAQAGYYQPRIHVETRPAEASNQINVDFTIVPGEQAKVGNVAVTGDSGMGISRFRKVAKLKDGAKVQTDTMSRALERLRKDYQKKNLLEATVKGNDQQFNASKDAVDFSFSVDKGPLVHISVIGAHVSNYDLKRLIPVYEEGTVDLDLLNEGDRNLRDHFQKQGYFDVSVTHVMRHPAPGEDVIVYRVERGPRHKVESVHISGNHYFDSDTILERLSVVKASALNRYGRFSQSLLENDVNAITALYRSNGFSKMKVTTHVVASDRQQIAESTNYGGIQVDYQIEEGPQQRIGNVQLIGVKQVSYANLLQQMNTRVDQPYSLSNLAGDRTAILTDYYRHGFLQVQMTITQHAEPKNPDLVDVAFNIDEGKQFFVNRLLISGVHYTRPQVVKERLELQPGDPLDRNALLDTQRRLYNLALFNEVDAAVVNPQGEQQSKDVLLNLTEAHRWNYDYGLGFEVQTGTPQRNCPSEASLIQLGINPATFECSPNGKFGASPRVSFDVSRINFRGRNQTLTLQTAYGTLEQQATMIFDNPNFYGHRTLDFSIAGGYINSQDITTYEASSISSSVRLTSRPTKADTLIYSFAYRYVYVNPNSLQVSANLIPLLSQPVRVSGPSVTWVHDTRDNPLNATRGWYLSGQQFFAWSGFGAQSDFNRIDITQANYFKLNKQKWILARSTRFGIENTYGNPSYGTIPLPERLYTGGATSHRGFSVNSAGPRDLQTGYPIGGSGAFINTTELRIPPIALPFIGNNLGFAIFNDMGNVYDTATHIWPSLIRARQPNRSTCYNVSGKNGVCDFNYNSADVGLGLRYKTPIGPIRLDFSYNLKPTIYPVILSYSGLPPYVGNSGHFNFFFSVGQAF
ncbi:MAG TPA: POTRA domain-containing protein [Acidobacteriaceae bacterium]|nr:POTRA domain-containing protein [Acidobacteriaceae bacterium]